MTQQMVLILSVYSFKIIGIFHQKAARNKSYDSQRTARRMEKLRLKLITFLWRTPFNNKNQGCQPSRLPEEDFSLYYLIVCVFLLPLRKMQPQK